MVTGAGVIYYSSDSRRTQDSTAKKASKKERRKVKKEKEAVEKDLISGTLEMNVESECLRSNAPTEISPESQKITLESAPEETLPDIDEATVGSLSDQVDLPYSSLWSQANAL